MSWFRRESPKEYNYYDFAEVFTDEERRRYVGLAYGEEIAAANTAVLNEMEAVARIRLYERDRRNRP